MKKVIFFAIAIVTFLIALMFLPNKDIIYKKFILNFNENIENVSQVFSEDMFVTQGTIHTEHTSNLIHSANVIYNNDYNFKIEKNNNNYEIQVNDMRSSLKLSGDIEFMLNMFKAGEKLKKYKYLGVKTKKLNIHSYELKNFQYKSVIINIYTSKIFNVIKKYEIVFGNKKIQFETNKIRYSNNDYEIILEMIKKDNIVFEYKSDLYYIKGYYINNDYPKISVNLNGQLINISIKNNEIKASMTKKEGKFGNFKINISKAETKMQSASREVMLEDIMIEIMNEEIYRSMFPNRLGLETGL